MTDKLFVLAGTLSVPSTWTKKPRPSTTQRAAEDWGVGQESTTVSAPHRLPKIR
jgi:hypothetical protein